MAPVAQIRIAGEHRVESQRDPLIGIAGPFVRQTTRIAVERLLQVIVSIAPHFGGRRQQVVGVHQRRRAAPLDSQHVALHVDRLAPDALRQTGIVLRDALAGVGATLEDDRAGVAGRPGRLGRVADVRVE